MSSISEVAPSADGGAWAGYAEAAAALVLVAAVVVRFGFEPRTLVGCFLVLVLVRLSRIDLRERRLPNHIVLPAFALVLAAQIAFYPDRALEWTLAALGAALFLFVPLLAYPAGMGMGDVKLALLLGAALGKSVALALLVGTLGAAFAGLALLAVRGSKARKTALPFGPFLAAGAVFALLVGDGLRLL